MLKKTPNQQHYIHMTFFFFFLLSMLTFWFYVMPVIRKRGKKRYKATLYSLQILSHIVSSKLSLHEDLRSEQVSG